MSDLISRSDTMKRLRNYAEQKHCNGEVELANGILKAICFIEHEENIPTAYDVEKVAAELEKQKYENPTIWIQSYKNTITDMFIWIVKRGGVE